MNPKRTLLISFLFISMFSFSCFDRNNYTAGSQVIADEEESTMIPLLVNTLKNVNDSVPLAFRGRKLITTPLIKRFYTENQNLPVWTSGMKPNREAREMMRLIAKSAYYGLDTSFYQFTSLKELYYTLKEAKNPEINNKALEYELLMTHNCFKFMSHLHTGVLKPDTSIYGQYYAAYPRNFSQKLGEFINTGRLTEGILDLQPKSYQYIQLQKGMEIFLNSMVLNTDSFNIPDPKADSLSASHSAKEILAINNYYDPNHRAKDYASYMVREITNFESEPIGYKLNFSMNPDKDSAFIVALKKFQKNHGLHPDGKIGENTKNALLVNNQERFKQIAINLERLKWEKRRSARYVYVNIPSYKLRVVDKHMVIKTFKVVVGAKWTKTPLLNSQIEYFIANPAWNVPASISRNELLPKIKKDSNYLARNNYRVYDENSNHVKKIDWSQIESGNFNYRIQQGSGRGNALGKIKYIFPNEYNVYIHDTQAKDKFSKELRAYSHGCMRIEKPMEFGRTLLGFEKEGLTDSLETWVASRSRKKFDLSQPVPVYVRYVTCEANSKANITFYYDIYEKDAKLKELLFASRDI